MIAIVFSIKPFVEFVTDSIWNFVVVQLEKEEQERLVAIENGEIVRGKDTMLVWKDKYVLYHHAGCNALCIHYENGIEKCIIDKVESHAVQRDSLYLYSEEGFVVIDKNNLCRVLVTIPDKEFVNGHGINDNGEKIHYSRYLDDYNIKYLNDFREFSTEEQKNLKSLEEYIK